MANLDQRNDVRAVDAAGRPSTAGDSKIGRDSTSPGGAPERTGRPSSDVASSVQHSNEPLGGKERNRRITRGALGAGAIGLVVLTLGLVLNNQANFSKHYLHDQLAQHNITFTPFAGLNDAQKKVPCLLKNAGRNLTTGKQAECYANYQIGLDLPAIDNGKGYAQDHYAAYLLRLKTAEAVRSHPDDPATLNLVQQSNQLTRKADDLFAGETMRGLLLSAYGFSLIGERAAQAALTCFLVGSALILTMLVSFGIASRKTKSTQTTRTDNDALQTKPS